MVGLLMVPKSFQPGLLAFSAATFLVLALCLPAVLAHCDDICPAS